MTTLGSLRTFVFTLAMGSAAVSQTRLDLQRQTNANIHQDSSTGHISATKGFSTPLTAVSFSPTPAFDAGAANVFTLVLSGDVTGSTLTNAQSGQVLVYRICQNTAGSHSFSWPANFRGGGPVSTAPSACSQQTFVYDGSYANALGAVLITGLPGGSVTLPGTTSGSTSLQPAAIASGTLTLPAATDTLVGQNTIDTLQNKTINGTSNFLFPTAQQTIAGFSGCGGGKFLKDDGTCTAASVSGSSTSTLDPSLASFQDDFPPVSVVAPYIGEWRWGGNCAAGDQDSSRDNPGIIRFSNQGATGSTCVVRPWAAATRVGPAL